MKKLFVAFLLALMGSAAGAFASGLSIPEQGAAAMGMSAAMTARSQDLSAIFYNPAGLDYVERNEFLLGLTPIRPSHTYESGGVSVDAIGKTFLPPQVYYAHRKNSRLVLGGGIYAPFGLGTDWDPTWVGRYTSTLAEIQAIFINPTAAVQITKWLSFGLGYSWVYSQATIEKMVDSGLQVYSATPAAARNAAIIANTAYDSKFALDGEGGGYNWNTGILLKPSDRIHLGVAYRSKTDIDYTGQASFTHPDNLAATLSKSMPSGQDGSTTLHLPASLNVGVFSQVTERWDASVDVNFVRWSSYDSLAISLAKKLPVARIAIAKNWKNTTTLRFGTSFRWNEITTLRGGLLFDKSPVPDETFDPQLPDGDRTGFSLGLGRKVGMVNLDFSYLFLSFKNRDKNNFVGYQDVTDVFPPTAKSKPNGIVDAADQSLLKTMRKGADYPVAGGTYKNSANLFSVSASVKF